MAVSFKDKPILKIALAVIGVALGYFAADLAFDAYRNRAGGVEAEFDAATLSDPTVGAMFQALRESLPAEYEALKTEVVAQRRAGASAQALSATGVARMAAIRQTYRKDLAQAPSSTLQAYREKQSAVIAQLARESPAICARYSFATLGPADKLSPAALKLIGDLAVVQFRGIAAGRKNPAARDLATMSDADGEALVAGMKREGLSDRQLLAFGGQGPSVSEAEQCRTGVALTEALNQLPVDQADRITAFLVANS